MLTDYEEKRLEYNLALNDLNKFKKDYESKRLEITKRKYNSTIKEKEKNINDLKQAMDDYFNNNQSEIVLAMLKNNLNIADEYSYYNDSVKKDDNGKFFVSKKTKEEIIEEFSNLHNKVQIKYDNKSITTIIYNDLNRCLDIYQEMVLSKWSNLNKKKIVDVEEAKEIKKAVNKATSKKKVDENWFFVRIMLPIIIVDIICALFMLFNGNGCEIGSSEALSAFLCAFAVGSNLIVIFLTPVVLIYLLYKGISIVTKKGIKK